MTNVLVVIVTSDSTSIHKGIEQLLSSGRSLVLIQTYEEDRLQGLLSVLSDVRSRNLLIWQINKGLVSAEGIIADTRAPESALQYLLNLDEPCYVWFKDLYHHYQAEVVRSLRDLYYQWREGDGVVFLSAPHRAVPQGLERELAVLRLEMPSQNELIAATEQWQETTGHSLAVEPTVVGAILKGLTLSEVKHGLNRLRGQDLDEAETLRVLQQEKRRLIQKTGTLSYIPDVPPLDSLGGMDNLKDWLIERRQLVVSDKAEDREIVPKGMLLMGVSGCGKSLCVKAVSSAWRLPLYRMEMVRVFSGAYGSPETAFAETCHLMEEMAPAVLWIDEIEMGLSASGDGAADSVLSRIFAFFLTWMQEKPAGLFVAATANRIDLLPAEMIRKGRFDQVFFIDLPHVKEREEVFRIHLQKRGYDPQTFTPEVFADATEGWSGAEIEQCVISAATSARMEHRHLELKDLYAARRQIVPISTTMEEQVRHIRNWAHERAVRASTQ